MAKMFTEERVKRPRRNFFPLNYNVLTDLDAGRVIPLAIEEMLPGDKFKYSSEFIVRMQPTIAPILSKLNSRIECFFVPMRILGCGAEKFLEGGSMLDNADISQEKSTFIQDNDWRVLMYNSLLWSRMRPGIQNPTNDVPKYTIWNYLGLPCRKSLLSKYYDTSAPYDGLPDTPIEGDSEFLDPNFHISAMPLYAYWRVWYDFYRDENITYSFDRYASLGPDQPLVATANNLMAPDGWNFVLHNGIGGTTGWNSSACIGFQYPFKRAWTKNDYFESVLTSRQKGLAPALPFTFNDVALDGGISYKSGVDPYFPIGMLKEGNASIANTYTAESGSGLSSFGNDIAMFSNSASSSTSDSYYAFLYSDPEGSYRTMPFCFSRNNSSSNGYSKWIPSISLGSLTNNLKFSSGSVAKTSTLTGGAEADDIRNVLAVQSFLEKSKRFGSRYNELVLAHFGVKVQDYRLDRAEFLGSLKAPIVVSEIPQTSASPDTPAYGTGDTPQGNLAGRGVGATKGYTARYTAHEHGYFVVLFSIMPQMDYVPQGYDRKWIKNSMFDFFWPSLAHLSERQVLNGELYYDGQTTSATDANSLPFGYQGMYAEYRHRRNITTGSMADTFDYWHLSRKFDSRPEFNQKFVEADVSKRIFAVQDEPGYILHLRHNLKTSRPIPVYATPNDFGFR